MSTTLVGSGATSSGLTETGAGNILEVQNGGSAVSTTVVGGGSLQVESGGYATSTLISSGGSASVLAGATTDNVMVSSGGALNVAGTVTSFTDVFAGGVETVSSGGLISGASGSGTAISGGTVNLLAGGSAAFVAVSSGGVFNVLGEVLRNVGVRSGGIENVSSGGFISGAISSGTGVSAGGTLNILAGGSAAFVGVSSGGIFNVSGSVLSQVGVYSGGVENIYSGGFTSGASGSGTGISGGTLNLLAGGSAMFVGVSSGGIFNVSGTVLGDVSVNSDGVENVYSGGLVSGSTSAGTGIFDGGTVNVLSGGGFIFGTISSGGAMNVAGSASLWVSSGGSETVFSGGVAYNQTIFSGGVLNVSSGGIAHDVTLSGGTLNDAGTVTSNVVISSGGVENDLVGGLISAAAPGVGTTVLAGGTLNVLGMTSNTVLVESGGVENVSSGGVIQGAISGSAGTGTFVNGGGTLNVLAGGSASMLNVSGTLDVLGIVMSNVTIEGSGLEVVSSGGVVTGVAGSGTAIFGTTDVLSGGFLEHAGVSSGGRLNISAGATTDHITVSSGGVFNVAGTVLSNVAVDTGGVENVTSGGFISGATSSGTGISGGVVNLLAGGSAVHVGVSSGGTFNVLGMVLSEGAVYSGGVENVSSGGFISGAISSGTGVSGGTLNILAGGSAAFVGVSSGGIFNVSGTVLSNVGVYSGGVENVYSGGLVSGASGSGTGVSGGTVNVSSGGVFLFATVSSGGALNVSAGGSASVWVSSGGVENVSSGGLAFNQTIFSGGVLNVSSGGIAHDVTLSGGTLNDAGTVTSNVVVSSGGVENVLAGGLISAAAPAVGTTVLAGGTLNVLGMTSNTVLVESGGIENVSSGGIIQGTISGSAGTGTFVDGGGTLNVLAGGSASMLNVSGTLNVLGKITSNVAIQSGGLEVVSSGGAVSGASGSGTAVSGTVDVLSGGSFEYAAIFSGGDLNISAGGTADHISVSSGGIFDVAGDVLSNVAIYGGGVENVSSGGFISGVTGSGTGVSGGTLNLLAGGSAVHVGVYSGGVFNVSGSVLSNVSISSGGIENVYAGGAVSGASGSGTGVSAGGTLNILSGGYAAAVGIQSGGVENVYSGGLISGSSGAGTGVSGGILNLSAGGSASHVGVSSGGAFNVYGSALDNIYAYNGGIATVFSGGSLGSATISGGEIELQAGSIANGGIAFAGSGGLLKIDSASMPTATISGIAVGDQIDLAGVTFVSGASATLQAGDILNVTDNGVSYDLQLNQNPEVGFSVTHDSGTGTLITAVTPTLPLVNVTSVPSASAGQTIALSNLVTVSDPDGIGYQTLQLWDSDGTVAGGKFLINGVAQTGGHAINVPAGANVVFEAGTGSGTDTIWAQLIQDNGSASGWDQFAVTVPAPTMSVSSVPSATSGEQIALSSLVTVSDPSNATYQLQLWDSDGTAAGGEFLINGVAQTGGHAINVPAGANVVFDAGTSAGTDTLWAELIQSNGTATGWQQITVTVPAPTMSVTSVPSATAGAQIALSSLVTISDPSNATYQLQLWDSDGTVAGGEFLINGVAQTGGHAINVPAGANVVFDAGTGSGTDTLWAQLVQSNGTASGWKQLTVTVPAPTMSVTSVPITTAGAQIALSSLVTVSDPSNATYQLQLWDSDGTAAGGEFLINGVAQTGGHAINVPSGANVVFDAGTGSGTDTIWAQLVQSNGTASGWEQFTVTVPAPTVTVHNDATATSGQQIALSNLVTIADPGNVSYQLQLWDSDGTAAGGEFLINGVAQTGGHAINVPAGANVVFDAGTSAGTDTIWAQLVQSNGTASGWEQFTVTVPKPTVTVHNDASATSGQQIALSSLVSIADPGNVGYQTLQLWDSDGTTAGGEFLINGVAQTGGHAINVPAGANVVFDAGISAGTDTLWAQLVQSNGAASGWEQFAVTVPQPSLTVHSDTGVTPGQSLPLSNLVTISDPGQVVQQLELWDSNGTAATGQFVVNGVPQTGGHEIDVTLANVANTVFDEGTSGASDTLWARLLLNNGSLTPWEQFTVVDPVTVDNGATLELTQAYAGEAIFAGNSGTLQLDDSRGFSGTVSGMTGADTLDLRDVGFSNNTALSYAANATHTGGSLSISDGTHLAQIGLVGQYGAASFVAASDGHGGISIELQTAPIAMLSGSRHA